jgi:hypothetical protein
MFLLPIPDENFLCDRTFSPIVVTFATPFLLMIRQSPGGLTSLVGHKHV